MNGLFSLPLQLYITFLPVYTPSAADVRDPDLFAATVQSIIAKALDVPCTGFAFEDVWLGQQAVKNKLDPNDYLLEWTVFRTVATLARADLEVWWCRFMCFACVAKKKEPCVCVWVPRCCFGLFRPWTRTTMEY
jgi:hypothetical protein